MHLGERILHSFCGDTTFSRKHIGVCEWVWIHMEIAPPDTNTLTCIDGDKMCVHK